MNEFLRAPLRAGGVLVVALLVVVIAGARPASAAPGDLVASVTVPEPYPRQVAPSVAFDGTYLYYAEYAGSVLYRIDVPPAGGSGPATGQVAVPIQGAPSGIMTLAFDAGRNAFWAIGGDGVSMYLLTRSGAATLVFTIDESDRPGFVPGPFPIETKVAYDRSDDTIWYSPDGNARIFHYQTSADALGTAQLVSATPYVDVSAEPNDMTAECGYSQSSGVAVGGASLFVSVAGCSFYFEYTKTGGKVAAYAYNTNSGTSTQDIECDNVSYAVPVFWIRDGYDGQMRAFEQPAVGACVFGGGAAAAPPPTPTPTPTATPTPTPPPPTPTPTPTPLLPPLPIPTPLLPTLPPIGGGL